MIKANRKPTLGLTLYWATQLSGVALEVAVCVVLGYWGDRRWGTTPWLLIAGSIVGMTVSTWHLWKLVRSMDRYTSTGSGSDS
ncbi:AtpZ/AtpI family protein [Planctomicrobium sp. SH664]|uniref:AtpZ/AtpI family protein n=1 Tax=Planctomicrobium sp. SH664 TaxID=3448125 RepID=UPI003F5AF069